MQTPTHTEVEAGISYLLYLKEETEAPSPSQMDTRVCRDIKRQIKKGDPFAWFRVEVYATEGQKQGRADLGGCNYPDLQAFLTCPYWEDLKREARRLLKS